MKEQKITLSINIIFAFLIALSDALYITIKHPVYVLKTLTSSLFLLLGIINLFLIFKSFKNKSLKIFSILLVFGLLFSFLGDILLIDYFIIGAIFFAIGHIFFFLSYCFLTKYSLKDIVVTLFILIISLSIILFVPYFSFGSYFPIVIAYACIISLMLAKSLSNLFFNTKFSNKLMLYIFIGSLLFYLSDLMLVLNMFTNITYNFGTLCLAFYYPAQFLLASSIYISSITKISSVPKLTLTNKIFCRLYQFFFKMLLPFLPYREPKLLSDYEELSFTLSSNNINSIIIITTKDLMELNLTDNLLKTLKKHKINYTIYSDVLSNPTIEMVEQAKDVYVKNNCNGIIAFGGGSALDCAKMVGARIARPKMSIQKMKGLLKIRKKLPLLIAIPTTAGTGSETTVTAVITDEKTHIKFTINDFCLIPHYALLDYNLTLNLPKFLTATTGMDALTHAIESYIGNSTTKYTRKMSEEATKLIVDNLYTCYQDGNNTEARKNMLLASYKAGIAFTRAYVGYVHAIAHTLGGKYQVPHGLANAKILPVMLKEYGKCIHKKLSKLSKICKIADDHDNNEIASNKLIEYIENTNRNMNIDVGFSEIKDEDIETLSKIAESEANPLYPVPKLLSSYQLGEIYKKLKK